MAASERPAPPQPEPHLFMLIGRAFASADIPALCEGIQVVTVDAAAGPMVCDASALVDPDLGTIDGLARLALALRRLGYDVRLGQAPAELIGLMTLVGLADVVPCAATLPVEVRREPEHGEELRRVEEEDDPADPAR